jgi:hypothetical protein
VMTRFRLMSTIRDRLSPRANAIARSSGMV